MKLKPFVRGRLHVLYACVHREREGASQLIRGFIPQSLQQLGLSQQEAKSLELCMWQEAKYLSHHLLLPRLCFKRKLGPETDWRFDLKALQDGIQVSQPASQLLLQMPSPSSEMGGLICGSFLLTFSFFFKGHAWAYPSIYTSQCKKIWPWRFSYIELL